MADSSTALVARLKYEPLFPHATPRTCSQQELWSTAALIKEILDAYRRSAITTPNLTALLSNSIIPTSYRYVRFAQGIM